MGKILVVEDNPVNMELVRDLLEINSHTVIEATSGQEAIDSVKSDRPDLILMDLQLPGIDGLEAARIISNNPNSADIPIVALTAFAMKTDENKAREAGCVGFITKPINTREFPRVVESYLPNVNKS